MSRIAHRALLNSGSTSILDRHLVAPKLEERRLVKLKLVTAASHVPTTNNFQRTTARFAGNQISVKLAKISGSRLCRICARSNVEIAIALPLPN